MSAPDVKPEQLDSGSRSEDARPGSRPTELNRIMSDDRSVSSLEIRPLHVAREVVGQPVDLRSDPPRDIG